VTQRCYIKTLPDQNIVAMKKLEMLIDQAGAVCNRPATERDKGEMVNYFLNTMGA
jgi:hypothetical protein